MKFKDRIPEASKTKVVPWVPPIEVDPKEGELIFLMIREMLHVQSAIS